MNSRSMSGMLLLLSLHWACRGPESPVKNNASMNYMILTDAHRTENDTIMSLTELKYNYGQWYDKWIAQFGKTQPFVLVAVAEASACEIGVDSVIQINKATINIHYRGSGDCQELRYATILIGVYDREVRWKSIAYK